MTSVIAALDGRGTAPPEQLSRLVIDRIELINFKSYGGRCVIGPIHSHFNCIVGPNGSGKSNIVDAMLFVFGRRAQQLRMKKVSDLIHRSSTIGGCKFCRVNVYLKKVSYMPAEPRIVFDMRNSGFTIGREARIDGTSQYFVNERSSKREDIVTLLQSHGVDMEHNRFLILQGEVEQIALLKPKGKLGPNGELMEDGLLEFLEDITGSSRYVEPLKEAQNIVNEADALVNEAADSFRTARGQVDGMRDSAQVAADYCRVDSNLHRLKYIGLLLDLYADRGSVKKGLEMLSQLNISFKEWSANVKGLRTEQRGKEDELKSMTKFLGRIERGLEKLQKRFEEIELQDKKNNLAMGNFNKEIRSEQAKRKDHVAERDQLLSKVKALESRLPAVEAELEAEETAFAIVDEQYNELRKSLDGELKSIREELKRAERKRERPLIEYQRGVARVKALETELSTVGETLEGVLGSADEAGDRLRAAHASKKQLEIELAARHKEIKECDRSGDRIKANLNSRDQEIELLKRQKTDLQQRQGRLVSLKQEAKNRNSRERLEQAIEQQRGSGQLAGYLGNLWRHVEVPNDVEMAMTTCGRNGDLFVCENAKTAQEIVRIAKERLLGRATCIVIDQVKRGPLPKLLERVRRSSPPTGSDYMFNRVVTSNESFMLAAFSKIQDTLIVSSYEDGKRASRCGSTRYRVATTEGAIFEKNGVVGGGMTRVRQWKQGNEGVSPAVDVREIEEGAIELQKLNGKHSNLAAERNKTEERLNRTMAAKREAAKVVTTYEERLGESLITITECNKVLLNKHETEERTSQLRTEQHKITRELDEAQKKLRPLKDEFDSTTETLEAVQKKMDGCGGETMAGVKSEKLQRQKAVSMRRKEANDCKKSLEQSRVICSDLQESSIPLCDERVADFEGELRRIAGQAKANEDEALKNLMEQKQIKKHREEKLSLMHKMRQEVEELAQQNEELNSQEQGFHIKFGKQKQELKVAEEALAARQKKLAKTKSDWRAIPIVSRNEFMDLDEEAATKGELQAIEGPMVVEVELRLDRDALPEDSEMLDSLNSGEEIESLVSTGEQLEDWMNVETLKLEQELRRFNNPNLSVFGRYRDAVSKCKERLQDLQSRREAHKVVNTNFKTIEATRLNTFMKGYGIISTQLKELYQMITLGGDADLEFVSHDSPFTEGVNFSVRPPKKSWKVMSNLSGGEKTLSSLSLIFALHSFLPSPLYFLDEIDAALDYRNVAIIAQAVAMKTVNTQFIIISLRNQMFERSDMLIGTFKQMDVSGIRSCRVSDDAETEENMSLDQIEK